jgi:transposase InsO family protein
VYHTIKQAKVGKLPQRRGPKPEFDDATVIALVRQVIDERERRGFISEGYRKILHELRRGGLNRKSVSVSKDRLLRLMREEGLLSPNRSVKGAERAHDGRITTDQPDEMWGTDMTSVTLSTGRKGNLFAVVDHCTQECLGVYISDDATRFSAIEAVKSAVENTMGSCYEDAAEGTILRHDCGSAYLSEFFQNEVEFLGLESSPAFVRQPQGNGVIERFFKTIKEQLLWLRCFETIDEMREAVEQWVQNYNSYWMVAKHEYRTPADIRAEFMLKKAA